jgi:hypothetical protein
LLTLVAHTLLLEVISIFQDLDNIFSNGYD